MARKKSATLTDAELRLMRVLWERGSGTVADIAARLPRQEALAYKTVLTIMRILETKCYVRHEKQGRAFVYFPVIDRTRARRTALRYLLSRFFDDSPDSLMLNLLRDERMQGTELQRLRRLLTKNQVRH
jgi:predicted transcriptional regulator